jgi:hypothetical protein
MNGGGGEGCARGAVSQVISKWVTIKTDRWHPAGQFAAATIAGGTTSAITGGKFATGAQTAAFGYLFNHWLSKSDIALLFKKPGHHPFAKQWADQFRDYISADAVEYLGKQTMGEHIIWEDGPPNPNRWSNETGHPEYNN